MLKVIFKGNVQGVGFRYTAKYYAMKINANGYVKNLNDGSVELITDKEELINMLKNHYKDNITEIKIEKIERINEKTNINGFSILFD
ncbi:MAG: acylphosphatase [Candidatus Anstonellales archaeon]